MPLRLWLTGPGAAAFARVMSGMYPTAVVGDRNVLQTQADYNLEGDFILTHGSIKAPPTGFHCLYVKIENDQQTSDVCSEKVLVHSTIDSSTLWSILNIPGSKWVRAIHQLKDHSIDQFLSPAIVIVPAEYVNRKFMTFHVSDVTKKQPIEMVVEPIGEICRALELAHALSAVLHVPLVVPKGGSQDLGDEWIICGNPVGYSMQRLKLYHTDDTKTLDVQKPGQPLRLWFAVGDFVPPAVDVLLMRLQWEYHNNNGLVMNVFDHVRMAHTRNAYHSSCHEIVIARHLPSLEKDKKAYHWFVCTPTVQSPPEPQPSAVPVRSNAPAARVFLANVDVSECQPGGGTLGGAFDPDKFFADVMRARFGLGVGEYVVHVACEDFATRLLRPRAKLVISEVQFA